MQIELHHKFLEAVKYDPKSDNFYRDTRVKGFEFRVGKGGAKTFFILYNTPQGKEAKVQDWPLPRDISGRCAQEGRRYKRRRPDWA